MTSRRTARLATIGLAGLLATITACSSATTTNDASSSSSADAAASSPAFPSESVPPGVQKDSVLDLNSTKDMTGVVTTVSGPESPYIDHLPDICGLVPDTAMQQLGVQNKSRGFRGTQLVTQSCVMQHLDSGNVTYSVTPSFYVSNFSQITTPDVAVIQQRGIKLTDKITAITTKLPPYGPDDSTFREECGAAWGTFFGSINVNYRTKTPATDDPCEGAIRAARILAPNMPKSPSEMRAAP
ncbi:hypothetical protein [Williamsia sp. M5A3_1d]